MEVARLCGFDQNSVNHPGILLMAHSAQLSLLDKVNPHFKSGRRLVKQRVTLLLRICSRQFRRLLSRYRESGPLCMANRC